jgi:glycosyltransferase involved in cell wall biosynthesis
MPPAICFIGHLLLPLLRDGDAPVVGGAEVQMFHLAEELHRRGWRTSFLVCALDATTPDVVATRLGPATVLYRRRLPKSLAIRVHEKLATWRHVRALSGVDFLFQRAVWDADVVALAARARRIPYLYALASDRDVVATPRWSRRRAVLQLANALVAQTELQREWVARSTGRRAVTIPSGFPVPRWNATAPRDEILWVGTLRALKRPEVFLDLAAAFPAHTFVVCGGAGEDPRLAADIARRAATLRNVRFEGFVPYRRMAAHFERARVLVNTSTYEGFPNTFVLAWLHGAVVLSMGVDPDGSLQRHGLGIATANATQLQDALAALLADEAGCRARAERARHHAVRVHDIGAVADAYERVLAALRPRA